MVQEVLTDSKQEWEDFFRAIEAAQQLQDNILKYGLLTADLYCKDVDSDWLETWEEEEEQNLEESLPEFLASDDALAIELKTILRDRSLEDMARELEKCLSLPSTEQEKIFAVKTFLVDSLVTKDKNDQLASELYRINLLELAENFVKKGINNLSKFIVDV